MQTAVTTPLISIITITYNAADCLLPTLSSVDAQTFNDYEHIIVDGASTDNTLTLTHSFCRPSFRVFSEPDKGLYDAMNKGLSLARGKYVLFLNAGDTFASPSTLSLYANAAIQDKDIIYGDTDIVDNCGKVVGHRHLSVPDRLTFKSFANGMLVCHQAFMVKKSLAPLYDLSYRFSADYDWTIKCIKNAKPSNCENLSIVAIHYLADGLTNKNHLTSLKERFSIMAVHYGLLPTIGRHFHFLARAIARKLKHR